MSKGAAEPDDLLSEMAGAEIDRLLADGEEPAPSPAPAPAPSPSPPPEVKATVSQELDELLGEGDTPPPASPAVPEAEASPPAPPAHAARVSPVAAELEADEAIMARGGLRSTAASAAPEAASAASPALSPQAAADPEQDLAELMEPVSEEASLPLLLRPLEWLSAPLAACPPAVRDALGKVAILTLVNSLAVLLYVLIFRRG